MNSIWFGVIWHALQWFDMIWQEYSGELLSKTQSDCRVQADPQVKNDNEVLRTQVLFYSWLSSPLLTRITRFSHLSSVHSRSLQDKLYHILRLREKREPHPRRRDIQSHFMKRNAFWCFLENPVNLADRWNKIRVAHIFCLGVTFAASKISCAVLLLPLFAEACDDPAVETR